MYSSLKVRWFLILFLGLVYGGFFANKINLEFADIGRHIKNGEMFFRDGAPLRVNLYSYTEPDHKIICHHWASNALYYVVWKWRGFEALSVLNIFIYLSAVWLFVLAAVRRSSVEIAAFFAALVLPILIMRDEVRPEVFSYFFIALYYFLYQRFLDGRKAIWLFLIPLAQILWVNFHFYFFIGPFMSLVYLLTAAAGKQPPRTLKTLLILFIATSLACFVNPYFIEGALVPFSAIKALDFAVIEMMPLTSFFKRNPDVVSLTLFLFSLSLFLFVWLAKRGKLNRHASDFVFLFFFCLISFKAVRAISLFAFVFIPAASFAFWDSVERFNETRKKNLGLVLCVATLLIVSMQTVQLYRAFSDEKKPEMQMGIGLVPGVNDSAEFFKENGLRGPIFNDFDAGAYLIYHLYPEERVFIDGRPQEYSDDFFKQYLAAIESEAEWEKIDDRYQFNIIYAGTKGSVSKGSFLDRRLNDDAWLRIYQDPYFVILIRRNREGGEKPLTGLPPQ